ncbi:MAG TPA: hypothetical protein VGA63_08210 [Geopsychrobacteraceae bacterium]|jgi:hypothetical protein
MQDLDSGQNHAGMTLRELPSGAIIRGQNRSRMGLNSYVLVIKKERQAITLASLF